MLCIPDTFCRDLRISDVPATTGIDRDEAVINLPVPTTSNVIEYLTQLTSLIKVDWRSLLGGVAPELPNTTEDTLTLASTSGIAGILKCLDQHSRNLPQNTEAFLPTTDSNSTTPRVRENTSAPTATLPRLHLDRVILISASCGFLGEFREKSWSESGEGVQSTPEGLRKLGGSLGRKIRRRGFCSGMLCGCH